MSDLIYTAREGDAVDFICWQHYGFQAGAVETVLKHEANQHLAWLPVKLPIGTQVTLPELKLVRRVDTIKIWHDG